MVTGQPAAGEKNAQAPSRAAHGAQQAGRAESTTTTLVRMLYTIQYVGGAHNLIHNGHGPEFRERASARLEAGAGFGA